MVSSGMVLEGEHEWRRYKVRPGGQKYNPQKRGRTLWLQVYWRARNSQGIQLVTHTLVFSRCRPVVGVVPWSVPYRGVSYEETSSFQNRAIVKSPPTPAHPYLIICPPSTSYSSLTSRGPTALLERCLFTYLVRSFRGKTILLPKAIFFLLPTCILYTLCILWFKSESTIILGATSRSFSEKRTFVITTGAFSNVCHILGFCTVFDMY